MASDKPDLLEELKRRHVVRVAIAYVVAGWLLVQVATQVFPFFNIPNWAVRLVVILIVIGFPVAVALAWAFELTPEGIRRTEPAGSPDARGELARRDIGRKLNTVIIAVLVVAVALMGWRLLALRHVPAEPVSAASAVAVTSAVTPGTASATATSTSAPATQAVPAKSIAVLPFENLSNDKDNEYFVAGMQDLILTKLADIGDLKVISRTSTLQYGSHPQNLRTVGEQLGVATVLEGSVQKAGNQVLINVQLIDTASDSHVWAQSYQRTLDNIFGVEGEVAEKVATALNAKLSSAQSAQLAAAPTTNKDALDAFLRAEYQTNQGNINYDTASWKAALPLYRQAVAHDPKFALAWARLSFVESTLAWFGGAGESVKQLVAQARSDAGQAIKLAPDLAAAQIALGYCDYWGRGDYAGALKHFAAALKLKPNDADALAAPGYVERRQGRLDAAIASLQRAFALDPRNSVLAYETGTTQMMANQFADAQDWLRRALALDPHNRNAKIALAYAIVLSSGDIPQALAAVAGDDPFLKLQRVTLLTWQRQYRATLTLLDSVPDTPDNFPPGQSVSKALMQAELYRRLGDMARARLLYAKALPQVQAQLAQQHGIQLGFVWLNLATAQLGLGQTAQGLASVAKVQAIVDKNQDFTYGPYQIYGAGALYAEARRPALAVPLLAKALASPGIGAAHSPVLLWLDPSWDPIRHDPRFVALQAKYAKWKPAVIPAAPVPPSA